MIEESLFSGLSMVSIVIHILLAIVVSFDLVLMMLNTLQRNYFVDTRRLQQRITWTTIGLLTIFLGIAVVGGTLGWIILGPS